MKKIIIMLFLIILPFMLFAESIKDLEAYKLMIENQELYKETYEKGDYDKALDYAKNVRTYAKEVQAYLNSLKDEPKSVVESQKEKYVVIKGDTLWDIAAKDEFFGDPYKWPIIYNANKYVLADPDNPDLIYPGMVFHFLVKKGAE